MDGPTDELTDRETLRVACSQIEIRLGIDKSEIDKSGIGKLQRSCRECSVLALTSM